MSWQIISLGGSVIAPATGDINVSFISQCAHLLMQYRTSQECRSAIVTGGGMIARRYQQALREIVDTHTAGQPPGATQPVPAATLPPPAGQDKNTKAVPPVAAESGQTALFQSLDAIGIAATRVHAELVAAAMTTMRVQVLHTPMTSPDDIAADSDCIVSGGWYPGVSTDYIAMQLARHLQADRIINISDTAYIYTADPRHDPQAKPCRQVTWKQYEQIIGLSWRPGAHMPIDPYAAQLGNEHGISVCLVAPDIAQLQRALSDEPHDGSTITCA